MTSAETCRKIVKIDLESCVRIGKIDSKENYDKDLGKRKLEHHYWIVKDYIMDVLS